MPVPRRTEQDKFVLNVDPEKLLEAVEKVAAVGREFHKRGTRLTAEPARIGDSWTGKAARNVKAEIRGLAGHFEKFADGLEETRQSLKELAECYEAALETVEGLNESWREADDDYEAALGRAQESYVERASGEDASDRSPIRMALDPTYLFARGDAEAARKATRDRLQRRFDDLQAELRADTRTCAKQVSKRVPLPVEPALIDRYRTEGYVGLERQRPGFTSDMPLSRAATKAPDVSEMPEAEGDDDVPIVDGWDAAGGVVTWTGVVSDWYGKALEEGGYKAAAGKAAKFSRRVPVVGHAIAVAGVGNDIRNGTSAKRSAFVAVSEVGGALAVAGLVVFIAPAMPAALVAAAGVGGALAFSKAAEWVADSRFGKSVGKAFDRGASRVASAVSGGARSAWKAIF